MYPAAHVAGFALSSLGAGSSGLGTTGGLVREARGATSGFGAKMPGAVPEPADEAGVCFRGWG